MLYYGKGNFDYWQVRYVDKNGSHRAPLDKDYLEEYSKLPYHLRKNLNRQEENNKDYVRNDLLKISDMVLKMAEIKCGNPDINFQDLATLATMAKNYDNELETTKLFTTLYAAMISEWHYMIGKKHNFRSIYRHGLKIIACMQVLEGTSAYAASQWSKGSGKPILTKMKEYHKIYDINFKAILDVDIDNKREQYPIDKIK